MSLEVIRIKNLRNISEAELTPSPGLNLVWGANGSGKTSLLEAIYLLGRGRSFRESRTKSVIRKNERSLEVFGSTSNKQKIGIRKSSSGTEVRINGESVKKLSILAMKFPVLVITPKSHEILERGSEYRRRFLDWGVFHVEHSYQKISSEYRRILAQRNASLRNHSISASAWDRQLVEYANRLNQYREEYIGILSTHIDSLACRLLGNRKIQIVWKRGWPDDTNLNELLARSLDSDIKRGFTYYGAHRADMLIKSEDEPVSSWASRGLQKLIVSNLFLAQAEMIRINTGVIPIILMDDPYAELDTDSKQNLMTMLVDFHNQTFITTTDKELYSNYQMGASFHVEHGVISSVGV